MSGKKAQRTKGNVQPSSSSRSAKFLQHEGQAGLITFSALAGNAAGVSSSQEFGDGCSMDAEMRLMLRKMAKKDTITKLKAVQEFTLLCKEKDGDAIKNILSFWPRVYNKLAHEFDHRVRESTQEAHYQLTTKAGRNLAPQLKQLIVNWLMSHFDTHAPAANNAKMSFDQVFQEKKRKEVILFCKKEILQACEKNILRETVDTLSDPKMVPLEEREAKYNRFVSSTFFVLKYVLDNVEECESDDDIREKLNIVFTDKKFWKFAKHESPMIRTSFFLLLLTFCEKLTSMMEESLQQLSPVVLTNLDEQDSVVTKALWDVLLYSLSKFKNLWEFVNVRKAVWPKLWKLLGAGCHGNRNIVYPNLLPFIGHIPPAVAGEGTGFYLEFFNHIIDILVIKRSIVSESDSTLVIKTYMECARFILIRNTNNKELCDFIILDLIAGRLNHIFHSVEEQQAWYNVFIKEFQLLLTHLSNELMLSNENSSHYQTLYTDLWNVVNVVVFTQCEDDCIKFKFADTQIDSDSNIIREKFYTFLFNFVFECYGSLYVGNKSNCEVLSNAETDNENLFSIFLCTITKCYIIEIFSMKKFDAGEQLMKLISLSFNIDLIKCVCIEKLKWEDSGQISDEASNVDVCNTFVKSIILPIFLHGVSYEKEIVKITIRLLTVLNGAQKQDYLTFLFEHDMFSGFVLLASFAEVFQYGEDEFVRSWLRSEFAEKEIMKLATPEKDNKPDVANLKWQLLREYVEIAKEKPDKLLLYCNKLMVLIKHFIEKSDPFLLTNESVFLTFTSMCDSTSDLSHGFQETMFVIFQHNVMQNVTSGSSVDAMNKGFVLLMHRQQHSYFEDMVKKMIGLAKDCCTDQMHCLNLCRTVISITYLARRSSNAKDEVSYSEIMLEVLIGSGKDVVVTSPMFKFYSQFLKLLSSEDGGISILEACSDEKLYIVLKCFTSAIVMKDADMKSDIEHCIKSCEFLHFTLLDHAVNRCLESEIESGIVKELLQTFVTNEQLSEAIVDHVLMLTSPSRHNYSCSACDTYCTVVSIINDISCSRALVEMYIDDLRNNGDITNNGIIFGQFIKVLSCVICRWYEILNSIKCDLQDYFDITQIIITCVMEWKEDHSELLLFSSSLVEADPSIITLNINLINLLYQSVQTVLEVFQANQWDFLLCSMISWIQSCEESLDGFKAQPLFPQFMYTAFHLFDLIACVFESNPTSVTSTCNISPSIFLKEVSVQSLPALTEDTVTEWKELFLPTSGTSLLRIYVHLMKNSLLNNRLCELEQVLCSCIKFIPPFTINEFVCSGSESDDEKQKAVEDFCKLCCQILYSGSWCNKIGSYQLLTGLGELIEGKLCYISQKEDEEHEGMRSFPPSLIHTMETSRDETLKVLSAECVSIKDPLDSFEDMKGKSALLTYLLSWQLILQLFKLASPSNRALFANYFHSNNDVHDLVTCLFCLMSQSMNVETKKKITLLNFTFSEIRQLAFHLLTTSMQCIPALIRNWFNNHLGRADTGTVNRFVSNFISPLLLNNEFQNLNESSKEFNNMIIKTRPVAREIAAVYTVDEVSMELVVQLGGNHPLSPVTVSCGKRIGVSNSLWRQWMLQLNTFLSFQNGSILDGLALWKRNVDKRFEGVEECMVCFSVLHGSNYSLPSISCKTCKKKFHPACLYKWFNTSGKCTCPLCRNTF